MVTKKLNLQGSEKGNYYGLKPSEIKKITKDLGMNLRSGHVHFDDKWQQTIDDAVRSRPGICNCFFYAYKRPDG